MKLKLVNPLLIGQINTVYNVDKPLDAAVAFWNDLSKHITNNVPTMRISFMNDKNKLFHFNIIEKRVQNSKTVNFEIKLEKYKIAKETLNQFTKYIETKEKDIGEKLNSQDHTYKASGGKLKNAPSKKDKSSSSESSSESSKSSSESSSESSDDNDLYDFSKYRRMSQPIAYYSYTPYLYKISNFYTPTFLMPLTPYVHTWIPNP